jgi:hypothetical protein
MRSTDKVSHLYDHEIRLPTGDLKFFLEALEGVGHDILNQGFSSTPT